MDTFFSRSILYGQPGFEAGNFTFSVVWCLKHWTTVLFLSSVTKTELCLAHFATSVMCQTLLFQVKGEHICEVVAGPDKFPMYFSFSGLCPPQKALRAVQFH